MIVITVGKSYIDIDGYLKVKEYLENNNLRIKDFIDKDWLITINLNPLEKMR